MVVAASETTGAVTEQRGSTEAGDDSGSQIAPKDKGQVLPCQESHSCVPSIYVDIQVSRADEHAYCTTDGSNPTQMSMDCSEGIRVTKTGTILKAIVIREDVEPSKIAVSPPLLIQCYSPIIEPSGGTFDDHALVSIKHSQTGSTVYYTLDGSLPSLTSPVYDRPLLVERSG